MTKAKGYSVLFKDTKCEIRDEKGEGKIVGIANLKTNLYVIDNIPSIKSVEEQSKKVSLDTEFNAKGDENPNQKHGKIEAKRAKPKKGKGKFKLEWIQSIHLTKFSL